jgi:O-Antigen ligase
MSFLPVFALLIAAYVALRYSTWRAFLDVYIPVVFFLPMYYRWIIPVLPDPTFEQAAIVPIAVLFLVREGAKWRFSWMDLLILAFAGCCGYSEYSNTGYNEAQNLMFDMIASVVMPYVLAKGLVEPEGRSVIFARRIVIWCFAVSIISVYEFRFGVSPWLLFFRRFYPYQGREWVTTFRYGFARIAGPYGHAILAGLVLVVAFRLQRWLEWSGKWEPHFRYLGWIRISKARLITLGLLGGIVMTMVRGPWLGGFAGAAVTFIGRTKRRKATLSLLVVALLVVGIPAGSMFYAYASVGRARAKTPSQETAAYRMELLDKYVSIAKSRPVWGYGRNTWPRVSGAPSIDNYYLLLWLMHGMVALVLFVSIILIMPFRLLRKDMNLPVAVPPGSSLGFTLAGTFIVYLVTLGTVYMGLQTVPLFAILTGWSEGYLIARPRKAYLSARSSTVRKAAPVYKFRRIVVS